MSNHFTALPCQEVFKPTGPFAWQDHGEGLLTALDESWQNRCVLSTHEASPKLDLRNAFKPTECCSLAFCNHQGSGQQAFFMHRKLLQCLKPLIRAIKQPRQKAGDKTDPSNAKKRKPVYPEARKLLDAGFAVLKLESVLPRMDPPDPLEPLPLCDDADDCDGIGNPAWNNYVKKHLDSRHSAHALEHQQELCEKHWLHIGFMNHQSGIFTVVPLLCDTEGARSDLVTAENAVAYRSFEYILHHLDLKKEWKFSLCRILCDDTVLTESEMVPGHLLSVAPMPNSEEIIFWKGQHAEQNMRAAAAAAQAKKRARTRKRPKDTRPRRQLKLEDVLPQQDGMAAIEDLQDDDSSAEKSDDTSSSTSSSTSISADFESRLDNDDTVAFAEIHKVAESRDCAQDPSHSDHDPDDEANQVPNFEADEINVALNADIAEAVPHASMHVDPPAAMPDVPVAVAAEPKPKPRPKAEPSSSSRHRGGTRHSADDGSIARITIPGHGELVYYMDLECIQAKCNDPRHGDCRRQRSIKPGARPGQGRPIGLLVSWLMQQDKFETQQAHSHNCKPNHTERVEAREVFMQLEQASEFSVFERDKRPNEADEPEKIT